MYVQYKAQLYQQMLKKAIEKPQTSPEGFLGSTLAGGEICGVDEPAGSVVHDGLPVEDRALVRGPRPAVAPGGALWLCARGEPERPAVFPRGRRQTQSEDEFEMLEPLDRTGPETNVCLRHFCSIRCRSLGAKPPG